MTEKFAPTKEQRAALVRDAKTRMIGRARSWLQDTKVKSALEQAAQKRREAEPLRPAC